MDKRGTQAASAPRGMRGHVLEAAAPVGALAVVEQPARRGEHAAAIGLGDQAEPAPQSGLLHGRVARHLALGEDAVARGLQTACIDTYLLVDHRGAVARQVQHMEREPFGPRSRWLTKLLARQGQHGRLGKHEARPAELGRQQRTFARVDSEGAMARLGLHRRDLRVEQRHPARQVAPTWRVREQQEVAPPERRVGGRTHEQVAAAIGDLAIEIRENQIGLPAETKPVAQAHHRSPSNSATGSLNSSMSSGSM